MKYKMRIGIKYFNFDAGNKQEAELKAAALAVLNNFSILDIIEIFEDQKIVYEDSMYIFTDKQIKEIIKKAEKKEVMSVWEKYLKRKNFFEKVFYSTNESDEFYYHGEKMVPGKKIKINNTEHICLYVKPKMITLICSGKFYNWGERRFVQDFDNCIFTTKD